MSHLTSMAWADYNSIMVCVQTRDQSYGFLLENMSQEEFFEHWVTNYAREITGMSVHRLTPDSFDVLRRIYPQGRVLSGD